MKEGLHGGGEEDYPIRPRQTVIHTKIVTSEGGRDYISEPVKRQEILPAGEIFVAAGRRNY